MAVSGFPRPQVNLPSSHVHVWLVSLDQLCVSQPMQTLSEEELARADRFHFRRDGERFIVCRGVLRKILSLYLRVEPCRLRICYGPYGKPYLEEEAEKDRLQFNLSHSRGLALYAFTRGSEIGVDLEYIRRMPDFHQIAARFFSQNENSALNALPESQRQEAFFNCWTRKEAYIKAIGNGLMHPLNSFDVSLAPGKPARLLKVEGDPQEASRWSLKSLNPAPGYIAALAVARHDWQLQWKQWPGNENGGIF
jgi:4'-phosphopantetheinyl transferase